jgi:hypothetical protein
MQLSLSKPWIREIKAVNLPIRQVEWTDRGVGKLELPCWDKGGEVSDKEWNVYLFASTLFPICKVAAPIFHVFLRKRKAIVRPM